MADLIPVAADVQFASATTSYVFGRAGEILDQGEAVYLKSVDTRYWLARNDVDTDIATVAGIVMTPAGAAGDYCIIATAGDIDLGVTLVVSEEYTASSTAGAIHPAADLATTEYYTRIGYGKTAAIFTIDITVSGIQHP